MSDAQVENLVRLLTELMSSQSDNCRTLSRVENKLDKLLAHWAAAKVQPK